MGGKVCVAFYAIFAFFYPGVDAQNSHLEHVLPEKYTLLIYTNLYNPQPMFWGYVYINVHCTRKTSEIILNSKDLQIIKHEVRVGLFARKSLSMLDVSDVHVVAPSDQLIISLEKDLVPNNKYQIYIHYMKNFAPDFTEYQIKNYSVDEKSIKVAFTNFGSDGAPAVFPCFNKMYLKSRFKIHLAHPKGILGFSNMPRVRNSDLPFFEGWEMDEFQESVSMSTHLVSFALVKMKGKKINDGENEVPIRIWSLMASNQIDTAGVMAYKGYEFYSNYFSSKYSLPKLDILALPNVGDKGNEKYGLLTLDEGTVLYPNLRIGNEEFDIARNMCHDVSHQWIGSFVTMTSQSESWFHEALSDYLEEPCIKKIIDSSYISDFMELEVVKKLVQGLTFIDMKPLRRSVIAEDESGVTQGFSRSLTSEKAFSLIRMMNFFLGEEVFHEALITYMKTFGLKNSSLDQVWEIFTVAGEKTGRLSEVTVKDVMDSWITMKTNPVVSVRRDFERNVISVKQEPFTAYMTTEERKLSSNDCPIIPVSLMRKKYLTESNKVAFSFWLRCKEVEVSIDDDVNPDEWFLFNLQMNVLSRTDYDLKTWRFLQESLLDEKTFAIIDPLTRAHMIFDIFVFCRAEISEISYDFALETVKYLKHESKHCVWYVALTQLKKIYDDFVGTNLFKPFQRYVREIMTHVFNRGEFNKIDSLLKVGAEKSLKKLIVDASCLYGVEGCKKQSKSLFKKWFTESLDGKEDALSKIPLDIRATVLCYGIRKTDQEQWDQLHQEYRKQAKSQETRRTILQALGCSKNEKTLKTYLEMSLNPKKIFKVDSKVVFESLSQNKIGYPLMAKFLRNQYQTIQSYREDDYEILGSYMSTLILSTTKREDLNKLKTFIEDIRSKLEESENLVDNSYTAATNAIAWYERNERTFTEFLDKFSPKKKSRSRHSSPIFSRSPKIISSVSAM